MTTTTFIHKYISTLFCLCVPQQQQISSRRGPPSRLCPRSPTLASQTPACTTRGLFLTLPTPRALASAASACQPPPDTTPTCHHLTQTISPKISSPTRTCITARAPDLIHSPWWHQGTPEGNAPQPVCCLAQGPRAPGGPTAWWTPAWTPKAREWRPTAVTATPRLPVGWMSPSGGHIDWQIAQ